MTTMTRPSKELADHDAVLFMEEAGFPPVTPCIRSSDESVFSDPFGYFLSRRLGLKPGLSYSKALAQGTATHAHFEGFNLSEAAITHAFLDAKDEATVEAKETYSPQETLLEYTDRLTDDFALTKAWWDGACKVKTNKGTIPEFLGQPWWETLLVEEDLSVQMTQMFQTLAHCTIRPDLLLYHKGQNSIWVVDLKTCSEPTGIRAKTCPIEFQTWHYPMVMEEFRLNGTLWEMFPKLPTGVKIAGMIHILIQKPTIKFGSSDRPYYWAAASKRSQKSGEAKRVGNQQWQVITDVDDGSPMVYENEDTAVTALQSLILVKPKKIYMSEPSPELYAKRCEEWYLAQGDMTHREYADLPVEISWTTGIVEDPSCRRRYEEIVKGIEQYAIMPPHPDNFRMNGHHLRAWGRLSPYTPFYTNPLWTWPEIITAKRFIVRHRDDCNNSD